MKNKTCFIVGAGPICNPVVIPAENDFVYACDGGLEWLRQHKINPDKIMGDFDSLGSVPEGDNVSVFPIKKDYTDMWICVEDALKNGFDKIIILGGLGGRYDHTIANFQLLSHISDNGGFGILCDKTAFVTVIKTARICFPPIEKGNIGVFALSDKCENVCESGLEYSLDNDTLTNDFPLGEGNSFCGKSAEVSVGNGNLCVTWFDENFDINKYRFEKL